MDAALAKITNTLSAIDFAIDREVDSILYYHEIKGFIAKNQHESIDRIINEERRHFKVLSKMREEYS